MIMRLASDERVFQKFSNIVHHRVVGLLGKISWERNRHTHKKSDYAKTPGSPLHRPFPKLLKRKYFHLSGGVVAPLLLMRMRSR